MKKYFLIVIISFSYFSSGAQTVTSVLPNQNVTIEQDTMIRVLMDYTTSVASVKMTTDGYRIQLASSSNRKSVLDMKAQFVAQYPDVKAYLEYHQPTFRLRVGDFESKISAYAFQQEILPFFPDGFIVQDKISMMDDK